MRHFYRLAFFVALIYWRIRKPSAKGVGVIIEQDGKLLMVRHTYGRRDQWRFPGGGHKHSETAAEAASRELREELGLKIKLKYLGQLKAKEDFKTVNSTFFSGYYNGQIIRPDKKEIMEFRWWPVSHLPKKQSPIAKKFIEIYL
jgi:ADP-ribose pyrophosphatase YjhB (NUDIX family)